MVLAWKVSYRLALRLGVYFILCSGMITGCASSGSNNNNAPVMSANEKNGYYRVQRGDNLYRIGLRFNQSVSTLVRWNNLPNANAIEVGQLIRVRKLASATTGRRIPKKQDGIATNNRGDGGKDSSMLAPDVKLQWPVRGKVINAFNGHTQKGIDISGSRGTPVKAAASGTVQYAGDELRGYGRLVLIKHSNTTMTAYAYNDKLMVRNGQAVQVGQTIATMGDSSTTGVKLHFEVRVNSKAVNPMHYLPN